MEIPLPTTGRILEEEVVTAPLAAFPSVEEEPPSGGMIEEVGQPMQGVQATQGPEAYQSYHTRLCYLNLF